MSGSGGVTLDAALAEYRDARLRFHRYRREAGLARQGALALALAAATGVAAQVRVPLPFTPVPVTLQTFAVLLAGILLGARGGGASQALYVGLGLAGVPWFQGGGAGLGHLLGPTGGYLVGFVLAAALVGYAVDRFPRVRGGAPLLAVLGAANFLVIYGAGLPWLYGWLALVEGSAPGLVKLLTLGLFPFVPGDVVKLLGAAAVGKALTPLESDERGELP